MVGRMSKDAILQNVKSSETVRTDMFNCVEKPSVCLHAVTQALVKKLMSSKSEWQSPLPHVRNRDFIQLVFPL